MDELLTKINLFLKSATTYSETVFTIFGMAYTLTEFIEISLETVFGMAVTSVRHGGQNLQKRLSAWRSFGIRGLSLFFNPFQQFVFLPLPQPLVRLITIFTVKSAINRYDRGFTNLKTIILISV